MSGPPVHHSRKGDELATESSRQHHHMRMEENLGKNLVCPAAARDWDLIMEARAARDETTCVRQGKFW